MVGERGKKGVRTRSAARTRHWKSAKRVASEAFIS